MTGEGDEVVKKLQMDRVESERLFEVRAQGVRWWNRTRALDMMAWCCRREAAKITHNAMFGTIRARWFNFITLYKSILSTIALDNTQ